MWRGIIHGYGKGRLKVFGVMVRVKGDFVQIDVVTMEGNLQEG